MLTGGRTPGKQDDEPLEKPDHPPRSGRPHGYETITSAH